MAGERLVKMMQEVALGMNPSTEQADILKGVVISLNPLKIKVKGEAKFEISEQFLLLSPFCIENIIKVENVTENTHSHSYDGQLTTSVKSGITEIKLWRGLQLNDRVFMLRVSKGNLYYVLQREGGL